MPSILIATPKGQKAELGCLVNACITLSAGWNPIYLGTDLEVSITPKANGNKLYVSCFIPDVYNNGSANHAMHSGFRYSDSNFSSGNGSILGPREFVGDHHPFRGDSGSLLVNLQYSLVVTVGTNAPSAGTAVKIRPWLGAINGSVTIAANSSNSSFGVFSLIVMEIQQ